VAVSLSLAAIARYYYDFLPLLMLMVYLGAGGLKAAGSISIRMLAFLGGTSVVASFALPLNAIRFYETYIRFASPWLKIFY
jgi:hypothetical protein